MSFFKPLTEVSSSKKVARLHALIWVFIYGGLLALVLGLSVGRIDAAFGWSLVVGGALVSMLGAVLIYIRSRMTSER